MKHNLNYGSDWRMHIHLGIAAQKQGHYADAEESFLSALEAAEKFGPEDTRLATTLNDLAAVYYNQGKYAQAEPLYKRALAIKEKALGPEHPVVATSLNNLAALYDTQGKYAQAEPLYKRALAILEKALGPEHPHVATSLENYATLLRNTKRVAEAEKLEARAREIRAKQQ
jgi:tetratricopeptide (TPR) repeat protein